MVNFRPVENKDFEKIAGLVSSSEELYLISPKSTFPWTGEEVKAIADNRQCNTVGVNENHEIIAYANIYNVVEGQYAFIGNVIVAKNYRHTGVGQALMQYMMRICQEKLNAVPQVSVFNHNTPALKFYHELDFTPFAMKERQMNEQSIMLIHFKLMP